MNLLSTILSALCMVAMCTASNHRSSKSHSKSSSSRAQGSSSANTTNQEIMTVADIALKSIDKNLKPENVTVDNLQQSAEHLQDVFNKVMKDLDNTYDTTEKIKGSLSKQSRAAVDVILEQISIIAKDQKNRDIINDPKNQSAVREVIKKIKKKFEEKK